jgi:hypothetical protein
VSKPATKGVPSPLYQQSDVKMLGCWVARKHTLDGQLKRQNMIVSESLLWFIRIMTWLI